MGLQREPRSDSRPAELLRSPGDRLAASERTVARRPVKKAQNRKIAPVIRRDAWCRRRRKGTASRGKVQIRGKALTRQLDQSLRTISAQRRRISALREFAGDYDSRRIPGTESDVCGGGSARAVLQRVKEGKFENRNTRRGGKTEETNRL